jgi:hypothetical protein
VGTVGSIKRGMLCIYESVFPRRQRREECVPVFRKKFSGFEIYNGILWGTP